MFCVPKHQETKEIDTKNNWTLQNYNAAQFFENCFKIIQCYGVMFFSLHFDK